MSETYLSIDENQKVVMIQVTPNLNEPFDLRALRAGRPPRQILGQVFEKKYNDGHIWLLVVTGEEKVNRKEVKGYREKNEKNVLKTIKHFVELDKNKPL